MIVQLLGPRQATRKEPPKDGLVTPIWEAQVYSRFLGTRYQGLQGDLEHLFVINAPCTWYTGVYNGKIRYDSIEEHTKCADPYLHACINESQPSTH